MAALQQAPAARSNVHQIKPHDYGTYSPPKGAGLSFRTPIDPGDLHKHLAVAPYVRMQFGSDKRLQSYRQMLYRVNSEGKFRYSTRREGWTGLIVLRLR
jgi:hypothetical protein